MIDLLVALLASVPLLVRASGAPSTVPNFSSELQQFASEFNAAATQLLTTIDGTVIDLSRAAYITVLLLGVFLYFTRLQRRLGRDLITGGIVLAVLSEFVFPAISKV